MADDKILDRLAKLMEMAERGDEHEAQVAAERAAELMAKHQIDVAELRGRDKQTVQIREGRMDADDGSKLDRLELWERVLAGVIAQSCGARAWIANLKIGGRKRSEIRVVGSADAVASARYLFMSVARQVGRLSRAATRSRGESNAWRRGYSTGMVQRIGERLEIGRRRVTQAASSTAMVHVAAEERALDDHLARQNLTIPRPSKLHRPDARAHGYVDGDLVDVGADGRKGLGEGTKQIGEE